MKHYFTAAIVAASIITFIPSTVLAQEAVVSANCDQVTITAPENSRVIFSIDMEPGSQIDGGQTLSVPFYPLGIDSNFHSIVVDSHHWFAMVLENEVQTSVQAGDVTGCAAAHQDIVFDSSPAPVGGIQPAAVEPVVAVADPPVPPVQLEQWDTVALAPPW